MTVRVDHERLQLEHEGRTIDLTGAEYRLAAYLSSQPGRIFERRQITAELYGNADVTDRAIDSAVKRLRAKAEKLGVHPIGTRQAFGYYWRTGTEVNEARRKDRVAGR